MKLYYEKSLNEFHPWGGAVKTYKRAEEAGKLKELEQILEERNPEGLSERELNDILWFEAEWIYEVLRMEAEDEA